LQGSTRAVPNPCRPERSLEDGLSPAFFVYRIGTARFGEYRDPACHAGKIRKVFKQAALVAKKIETDKHLNLEHRIWIRLWMNHKFGKCCHLLQINI